MTAALEGGEWSASRPGRTLPPGMALHPFYRRLELVQLVRFIIRTKPSLTGIVRLNEQSSKMTQPEKPLACIWGVISANLRQQDVLRAFTQPLQVKPE